MSISILLNLERVAILGAIMYKNLNLEQLSKKITLDTSSLSSAN